ncbi:uncharacterized protein LOC136089952 [Hydra vulgaris]|uniref:Uncharacterized protein LOC136089952 n=1 Tax=Hydra vulgaris TaxID=6087 RepID=A0ABM4DCK4_HYDVU
MRFVETRLCDLKNNYREKNNKFEEFKVLCHLNEPNIIGVTETWFSETSITCVENFCLYRSDRKDGRVGGGVCIYVNSEITSYEVNEKWLLTTDLEQIWTVLNFGNGKYLVGCIYRPNDVVDMELFRNVFRTEREYVDKRGFKDLLIMGDFNFPKIEWSDGAVHAINSSEHSIEHHFSEIINDEFLIQHVAIPTFQLNESTYENTLDLLFTVNEQRLFQFETNAVLGNISKGHLVICFKYALNHHETKTVASNRKYILKKADFAGMNKFFTNTDWVNIFDAINVQEMYDTLIFYVNEACQKYIPCHSSKNRTLKRIFWIDNELKELVKNKRRMRHLNCCTNWKNKNMVNEYKALCKTVKIETRKARKKYKRELVYKSIRNKKILFKYVNDQQNVKSSIKAIKNVEGNVTNTTSEIVDILNENFQNSFTREGDQELPEFGSRCGSKYLDFDESAINYSDVETRLSKLSIEKSCGVDQLSTII